MNVAEDELNQITSSQKEVQKIAKEEDVNCIKISCKFEAELSEMEPEERKEFLLDSGILSTGLDQVIQEGFRLLNQITYFTVGPKEVRAWNIEKNTLAPQAAGKIHSDMERGFICAEVYHYDAMKEYESEIAVKEAGKFRTEGKNYLVQDGDIMHFRFNV